MNHARLLLVLPLLCSFDRLKLPKGKASAKLGAPHVVKVDVPAHGKADQFDAQGWYARVTVELTGEATLTVARGEESVLRRGGPSRNGCTPHQR